MTSFSAAGRAKLAELRAAGKDLPKGGEVAKRRAAKLVQRMQDQAVWEATHDSKPNPEIIRREILPQLLRVPVRGMVKVTGLSAQSGSLIRQGRHVPHLRQ